MPLVHVQDPVAENAEGNTPLHWACLNGKDEVNLIHDERELLQDKLKILAPAWQAARANWGRCRLLPANIPSWLMFIRLQIVILLMRNGADASALNK